MNSVFVSGFFLALALYLTANHIEWWLVGKREATQALTIAVAISWVLFAASNDWLGSEPTEPSMAAAEAAGSGDAILINRQEKP